MTLSIETGQLESFKFLLIQLNADPNKCHYTTGYSPLHILATTRCQANINYKSRKNSSPNSSGSRTSSRIVLINQPSQQVSTNIEKDPMAQISSNDMGVLSDDVLKEMVYLLVDKGADMNKTIQVPIFNELVFNPHVNPLMLAIYNSNFIVVEELLNLGCDCNYQEENSKLSAIHLACYLSSFELVNLLLDDEMRFVKILLDSKSSSGNNCMHWLALSKIPDDIGIFKLIINYLTRKFTSSNASSPTSTNSMTEWSNESIGRRNLKGLDSYLRTFLDQTNNEMQTPLMLASLNNKQHLVRQILDYDATIDIKDKDGRTAYAYAKKNQSCSQLLQSFSKIKILSIKKSQYKINASMNEVDTTLNESKDHEETFNKNTDSTSKDEANQDTKNMNILNIKQVKSNDLAKII